MIGQEEAQQRTTIDHQTAQVRNQGKQANRRSFLLSWPADSTVSAFACAPCEESLFLERRISGHPFLQGEEDPRVVFFSCVYEPFPSMHHCSRIVPRETCGHSEAVREPVRCPKKCISYCTRSQLTVVSLVLFLSFILVHGNRRALGTSFFLI